MTVTYLNLATFSQIFSSRVTPVFVAFFGFMAMGLVFRLLMSGKNKDYKTDFYNYLIEDKNSNFSPKKNIPNELFYKPNLAKLPIIDYNKLIEKKASEKAQSYAMKKALLRMIFFKQEKSNIELKKEFGAANLENITIYEEHFHQYIQALISWAKILITENSLNEALLILKEIENSGVENANSFYLLADIYESFGDLENLKELSNKSIYLKTTSKHKVWEYINNKIDNLGDLKY